MKSEVEITEIVKRHGGKHLQFGNVPSWVTQNSLEGFEVQTGKLRSFWYKDNARVYGEAASEVWQKCINEVLTTEENFEKPNMDKIREQKKEQVPTPQSSAALIPESLTIPLLEKWKKMTTFERMLMFQKTNPENIEERKGRGGKVKYVKGNFMQQEANIAFLFAWSSKIEGWDIKPDAVACYGSVNAEIDGKIVSHSAVGIDLQEINKETKQLIFTAAELMKNAHTDMIKKGLSYFGFNGDVYRGEV